jgi:hypothetical protein
MGGTCSAQGDEKCYKILIGKPKGGHSEDLGVDGKKILNGSRVGVDWIKLEQDGDW